MIDRLKGYSQSNLKTTKANQFKPTMNAINFLLKMEHPTSKLIGNGWRGPRILYVEMQGFKCPMWNFNSQQKYFGLKTLLREWSGKKYIESLMTFGSMIFFIKTIF